MVSCSALGVLFVLLSGRSIRASDYTEAIWARRFVFVRPVERDDASVPDTHFLHCERLGGGWGAFYRDGALVQAKQYVPRPTWTCRPSRVVGVGRVQWTE